MKKIIYFILPLVCLSAKADELTGNTTFAERRRGAVFGENFENAGHVWGNGVTAIVGGPIINIGADFGVGAAEPTKLSTRGYSFDGGDYMLTDAIGEVMTSEITMVATISITALTSSFPLLSYEVSGGTNIGGILYNDGGSTSFRFYSGGGAANAAI